MNPLHYSKCSPNISSLKSSKRITNYSNIKQVEKDFKMKGKNQNARDNSKTPNKLINDDLITSNSTNNNKSILGKGKSSQKENKFIRSKNFTKNRQINIQIDEERNVSNKAQGKKSLKKQKTIVPHSRCDTIPENFSLMASAIELQENKNNIEICDTNYQTNPNVNTHDSSLTIEENIFNNDYPYRTQHEETSMNGLIQKINELTTERGENLKKVELFEKMHESLKKRYNELLCNFENERKKTIKEKFVYLFWRIKVQMNNRSIKSIYNEIACKFKSLIIQINKNLKEARQRIKIEFFQEKNKFSKLLDKLKPENFNNNSISINNNLNLKIVHLERENQNLKEEIDELIIQLRQKNEAIKILNAEISTELNQVV